VTTVKLATSQYPITHHSSWQEWEAHVARWIEEASIQNAKILAFPEYGAMEIVSFLDPEARKNLHLQVGQVDRYRKDFIEFFSTQAKKHDVAILAPSLPAVESEFKLPVNRAYFFYPDGRVDFQDKERMARFEDDDWKIGSGSGEFKVFEVFGVRVGVNICFDVEFPHAAHSLARRGAQILLVPSCTETLKGLNRVHIGARARALENQFYVVVTQTVGAAPWSAAVDVNTGLAAVYGTCDIGLPDDGVIARGELNRPQWVYAELDLAGIENVRRNGQVLNYKKMSEGKL
jgi:predicted amidohydrolase